jgi:hypothetical protein
MSGGLFTDALKHVKDRQEGKKLLVHERSAVGRMFDERESERFAPWPRSRPGRNHPVSGRKLGKLTPAIGWNLPRT